MPILGNAIHAIEDSFSPGHTERASGDGCGSTIRIIRILRYAGSEKSGHDAKDELWWNDASQRLSSRGTLAARAVEELLALTFESALTVGAAVGLPSWQAFIARWLAVDDELRRR